MFPQWAILKWPPLLILVCFLSSVCPLRAESVLDDLPSRRVVVIDPGHGGNDMGAVGASGLAEKVVTLSIAQEIRKMLSKEYDVFLTRDDDYALDIERRTGVANHYRAHVFVSIHTGSGMGHQGRGTVVFYHGSSAGTVSPRQNEDAWEMGEKAIAWDDIQGRHITRSKVVARLMHRQLLDTISPVDGGIRQAPCLVLRGADMPAVLVEIANLSHPAEEAALRNSDVITAAAKAMCEAIREYFTGCP